MLTQATCDNYKTMTCGWVGGKPKATACDAQGAYCTLNIELSARSCTADLDCAMYQDPDQDCNRWTGWMEALCDDIDPAMMGALCAGLQPRGDGSGDGSGMCAADVCVFARVYVAVLLLPLPLPT